MSGESPFKNIVAVHSNEQAITVSENLEAVLDDHGDVLANHGPYSSHTYVFDHVYDQNSSQMKVYETTARSVVDSALQGYNATIFAYGQTGTGKTFTMEGFNSEGSSVEARGIIPRAIEQVFGHIQRHVSPRMKFLVRASYLQIYNEQVQTNGFIDALNIRVVYYVLLKYIILIENILISIHQYMTIDLL